MVVHNRNLTVRGVQFKGGISLHIELVVVLASVDLDEFDARVLHLFSELLKDGAEFSCGLALSRVEHNEYGVFLSENDFLEVLANDLLNGIVIGCGNRFGLESVLK